MCLCYLLVNDTNKLCVEYEDYVLCITVYGGREVTR